jgi:guanylate kinase
MLGRASAFPLVIVAPSGAGKTTVCRYVLEKLNNTRYSISATTRKPRQGEKEGKDYYFLSRELFDEWLKADKFLEWAEVYDELYGTPRESVTRYLNDGYHVLFDTDIQGVRAIKANYPDCVSVFVLPPSISELGNRLDKRSKDSAAEITKRLKLAESEMKHLEEFDYVIVNEKIEDTGERIMAVIAAEECRPSRYYEGKKREKGTLLHA